MKQKSDQDISIEDKTLRENWDKYTDRIVLVVEDKIFATKRASKVPKMVEEIERKYNKQPLITYIPKKNALYFL